MIALWLEDGGATVREVPAPEPGPCEALLQLRVAALSPADVTSTSAFTGTPGTDAVASVLSSPVSEQLGQRVVLRHPVSCGSCRGCLAQREHHCSAPLTVSSGRLGGALAERFVWPASHLVAVPSAVRDYDAVMARSLAAGRAALSHADGVNRLLVVGNGPRPTVIALALRAHQRMVHLSADDEARAERFKRFGVLRDPGGRFPLVIHCPAPNSDLAATLRRVEHGGTILIDGSAGTTIGGNIEAAIQMDVRIGSLGAGPLPEALDRLAMKEVCESLSKVREESFPLSRADQALAAARATGALQILVDNL